MKLDLSAVPECVSCGTCCFSTAPDYLRVAGVDYERLGEDAESLVVWLGNRAYLRLEDGHCSALRLDPQRGLFLCSVYERRPDVCRWLERGSGHCLGEREAKGERPREALLSLRLPSRPLT
jgi:hypothetical protein